MDDPLNAAMLRVLRAAETWRDNPSRHDAKWVNDELTAAVNAFCEIRDRIKNEWDL